MIAMDFGTAIATGGFGLFWLVTVLAFTRWDERRLRARRNARESRRLADVDGLRAALDALADLYPNTDRRADPTDPAFIHADGSTWVAVSRPEFERACDQLEASLYVAEHRGDINYLDQGRHDGQSGPR